MDPEWLYSSTAQSSAAIIAIIGGFLVSRVLAVSSTREQLQRRRREVTSDLETNAPRLERVANENLEDDLEDFLYDAQDWVLALAKEGPVLGYGAADFVEMGVDPQGRDAAAFEAGLAGLLEKVEEARQIVGSLGRDEWPSDSRALRRKGVEIHDDDEWIWDGLLAWRNESKPQPIAG